MRFKARRMARYGVACPLPQEEEIVRPKMVIFKRTSPTPIQKGTYLSMVNVSTPLPVNKAFRVDR